MTLLIAFFVATIIGLVAYIIYRHKHDKNEFVSKIIYDDLTRHETLDLFLGIDAKRRDELTAMLTDVAVIVNSLQEELNMIKMLIRKHKLRANEQFFIIYALAKVRGAQTGRREIMEKLHKMFEQIGAQVKGFSISRFGELLDDTDDENEEPKKKKDDSTPSGDSDTVID